MAWNLAIMILPTGCQVDVTVPGLKMAPKAPKKSISDTELGNPYTLLTKYGSRETYKWCRRERMFQKANACL